MKRLRFNAVSYGILLVAVSILAVFAMVKIRPKVQPVGVWKPYSTSPAIKLPPTEKPKLRVVEKRWTPPPFTETALEPEPLPYFSDLGISKIENILAHADSTNSGQINSTQWISSATTSPVPYMQIGVPWLPDSYQFDYSKMYSEDANYSLSEDGKTVYTINGKKLLEIIQANADKVENK